MLAGTAQLQAAEAAGRAPSVGDGRAMADEILERVADAREGLGEVLFRTHAARLRLLELRARSAQSLLANPDVPAELIQAKVSSLARDWWRAAAALSAEAGRDGRPVPEPVVRRLSPVRPSVELVRIDATSVTVRFRVEADTVTVWATGAVTVQSAIGGSAWRAIDPLPDQLAIECAGAQTWERTVRLECRPEVLRQQPVIPLRVRFGITPAGSALPPVERVLERCVGDPSILTWYVRGPLAAAAGTAARDEISSALSRPGREPPDPLPAQWRVVRGTPAGRLDPDVYVVDLTIAEQAAWEDAEAFLAAPLETKAPQKVEMQVLSTGPVAAWLDDQPQELEQMAAGAPSTPSLLGRWRTSLQLRGRRHLLVLRCMPPPAPPGPWQVGALLRDARGDPVLFPPGTGGGAATAAVQR